MNTARPHPHFARIARKLDVIELMNDDGEDTLAFTPRDLGEDGTDGFFLDFYSDVGMKKAFDAYGITAALHDKGIDDYRMKFTRDDAFHHRMEIFLDNGDDDDHRIMDLRVHLCSADLGTLDNVPLFVVEWLAMQNPLAVFTKRRPRLPGQTYPGSGFGRATENLLIIAAQRLRRHALIHIPERFHLAELYRRGGSRFIDEECDVLFEALYDATRHLSFAERAWAVDRGFVYDEASRAPIKMKPTEMALPLSKEISEHIADRGFFKRWLDRATAPRLHLDEAAFRAFLAENPIEGLAVTNDDERD